MSDYLAVAGVSVVLKWFLTNALTAAGGPASIYGNAASVSVMPPDIVLGTGEEPVRLNLFMYYSSIDPAFRNSRLPAYDSQGNRLTNPPLALDLHYLMSAYGPGEFDSEILLGWAMQQFQETPIFSRAAIQNWLAAAAGSPSPSVEVKAVALTTLPFQFESIKVTPASLTNDEISQLWMAFSTHYRATTAYRASVVLITETQPAEVQSAGPAAHAQGASTAGPVYYRCYTAHGAGGRSYHAERSKFYRGHRIRYRRFLQRWHAISPRLSCVANHPGDRSFISPGGRSHHTRRNACQLWSSRRSARGFVIEHHALPGSTGHHHRSSDHHRRRRHANARVEPRRRSISVSHCLSRRFRNLDSAPQHRPRGVA